MLDYSCDCLRGLALSGDNLGTLCSAPGNPGSNSEATHTKEVLSLTVFLLAYQQLCSRVVNEISP